MSSTLPSRFSLWLVVGLFSLFACCTVLFPPVQKSVAFSAIDDGLYYPKLARNIVTRHMCTYDGVTKTNGFHPLWLLLLLPVYGCVPGYLSALKAVYFLIFLIQLISILLFAEIARRTRMSNTGFILGVFLLVLNIRSFTVFFSLLESPLVLLCYLAYLFFCLHTGSTRFSKPIPAAIAGMLIGICFLARLDGFLLAVAYGTVWLLRVILRQNAFREAWRGALFSAAGCLLPVVPYLLWNVSSFGHVETVSAWQKVSISSPVKSCKIITSWCRYQFVPRVKYILGIESIPDNWIIALMVLAALGALVFILTGSRRQRMIKKLRFCPEFMFFVPLHALFIALLTPLEASASAWYWVPEILLLALLAGACMPEMKVGPIQLLPIAVTLLMMAQLAFYPVYLSRKTMSFAKLEVADFLQKHCEKNVRGAMFDSGIVSYFSQRDFVGLNGLIGDFKLATLIRDRQYDTLAKTYDVSLLVLDSPPDLLREFSSLVLFSSSIQTKYENFCEEPKPFVVYRTGPDDLKRIWQARYNGQR